MAQDRRSAAARQRLHEVWLGHTSQNLVLCKVEVGTSLYDDYESGLLRCERLDTSRAADEHVLDEIPGIDRERPPLWFRNVLVVHNPRLGAYEVRIGRSENSDVRYE